MTQSNTEFDAVAVARYPNEAGAVFIKGRMFEVQNVSPDPTKYMEFSAEQLTLLELQHGAIDAFIHSHPYSAASIQVDSRYQPQWPTHRDMEVWIALNRRFGIVATDGTGCSETLWLDDTKRAPLQGREFVHGVQDCYSLIRDYYKSELSIDLPNFPRGWDWWNMGGNLYLDGFPKAGFHEIPRDEALVGDVLLYQVGTRTPNHASVIIGPNGILHHLIDRVSRVEQRSKWQRCEVLALRHKERC